MTISQPDNFRDNLTKKIDIIIKNDKISRNIERGVYNFALKQATTRKLLKKWDNPFFVQIYLDRMKSIYFNIEYPPLCESIQRGDIKPSELAFMPHQEMRPDKWAKMIPERNYTAHELELSEIEEKVKIMETFKPVFDEIYELIKDEGE